MPGIIDEPFLRKPKKLIVCCDGTWMDSDSGWVSGGLGSDGHLQTPSNVTRICRAIPCEDSRGSPQVVYYQAGVGTGLGWTNQILGGGTGLGLAEHIREAYSFLANNYGSGDLIYLIGFSRGAFTARSLAGLIGQLGLLNKKGLEYFYEIFEDWEHAGDPDFDGPIFLKNFKDEFHKKYELKTPANDPSKAVEYLREYRTLLRGLGLMHKAPSHDNPSEEVRIQAVACWDTVGALGIPVSPLIQRLLHFPAFLRAKHLRWMDTTLTDNIMNAFQALALDEHRAPFSPAVWEKPKGCETNLKQVWFPGAHSGVGGGYDDTGSANVSLAWMMDQLSGNSADMQLCKNKDRWIEFRDDYLPYVNEENLEWYKANPPSLTWGNGALFKSFTFPMSLAGYIVRHPGRYRRLNNITCKPERGILLRDTNEYVHASVRTRIDLGGDAPIDSLKGWHFWSVVVTAVHKMMGRTGKTSYRPAALNGWRLKDGHGYHDELAVNNVQLMRRDGESPWWEWEGRDWYVEKGKRMYEDRLGKYEQQLLGECDVAEEILASNQGSESVSSLQQMQMMERDAMRSRTI